LLVIMRFKAAFTFRSSPIADSTVCCTCDCFLMCANNLMQTISSSSSPCGSRVLCVRAALEGRSMLVLVIIELCCDAGLVSRAIGDRYLTCGGLSAGVGGRPLRLPIYCSFVSEKHLVCSISNVFWYWSSGVSHVGGVRSSAMKDVQLESVQERFDCSSDVFVVAGEGIDGPGKVLFTTQASELTSPIDSSSGRFLRFPTTFPTLDSLKTQGRCFSAQRAHPVLMLSHRTYNGQHDFKGSMSSILTLAEKH
jgi:hypothetical protein